MERKGSALSGKGCLLLMMFILLLSACSQGNNDRLMVSNSATPEDAKAVALYKKRCISCHAVDLSGKVGPSLQGIGTRLTEQQLMDIVHDGGRGMPSFKKMLSAEEIRVLAQWLAKNG